MVVLGYDVSISLFIHPIKFTSVGNVIFYGILHFLGFFAGNQQCNQSPFTDLNTKGLHLKNPQIKRLTQDLTGNYWVV